MGTLETLAPGILIASPALRDPNFDHAVVLVCAHNEQGAMGLVINRPAPITSQEVMTQMGFATNCPSQLALIGGPVASQSGLLLYAVAAEAGARPDELKITDTLRLSPNSEVLREIAIGKGPEHYHIFLGHSGWGPGQLEQELAQGAWIPGAVNSSLIFDIQIERRWEAALHGEGISPSQLSSYRPQN